MNTAGDAQLFDSKAFEAKYKGVCLAECGDPILPGERIMYVGTVTVHEACAQDAPVAGADEKPTKFQGTSLDEMGY